MLSKIKSRLSRSACIKPNDLAIPTSDLRSSSLHEALASVKELVEFARRSPGVLRLHLGCGQCYFPGYVNIDYPPGHHTVQVKSPADLYADIRNLSFEVGTVGEVRLHHVFEHFDRPTALRLLADWHEWLIDGGMLLIETPDFDACARIILSRLKSWPEKAVAMRHLFGSHEAHWAYHLDGWNKQRFRHTLREFGFLQLRFKHTRWQGTRNIIVKARKVTTRPRESLEEAMRALLAESLVDETEQELQEQWVRQALCETGESFHED